MPADPARDTTRPPILIIGAPRSGTTLLATMLNAHPNIFLANESKLLIDFLPDRESGGLDPTSEAQRLLDAASDRGLDDLPDARRVAREDPESVADLIRALFSAMAERRGKDRWGEKTAVAYRRLPALVRAFPDAWYIGLDRSPSKVAASYARINPQWGAAGGLLHWLDFRRAVARQGPGFRYLSVRYEDLVEDTEATLERVCDFIDEPYHPDMLEHHRTERAQKLAEAPEFAGAARPVYHDRGSAQEPLPSWLLESARRYAHRLEREERDLSPPPWEPVLRTAVNTRLVFREVRAQGTVPTLKKILGVIAPGSGRRPAR